MLNILFEIPIFVKCIYRILEIHQACTRQTGIGKDHLQPMYLLVYNREPITKQIQRTTISISLKIISSLQLSKSVTQNHNLPRGNDIEILRCCVPYMYQEFRSHYPRRCLLVVMNECQRKFPQMWHSHRLPFHNKDSCRSHSNRWLYSFQGSRERRNIAKSRLIKSKSITSKILFN